MANLSFWQLLLRIVAILMIVGPVIAIWVNVMIIGYFRAKEAHTNRNLGAFVKALEQTANTIAEKIDKKKEQAK